MPGSRSYGSEAHDPGPARPFEPRWRLSIWVPAFAGTSVREPYASEALAMILETSPYSTAASALIQKFRWVSLTIFS